MKILNLVLILISLILFNGCDFNRSVTVKKDYSATVQPTVDISPKKDTDNNAANTFDNKKFYECVRAEPEAIVDRKVFPKTTFRLEKNKEFPTEILGYETVEFENGDKLLIENVGCENFTLIFHFETDRFLHDTEDVRFWYKTSAELVSQTMKGLRETYSIKSGLKALNSHIKKTKQLKFAEEIDYCGTEIRCVVSLDEVKKLENNKVEIIVAFGTGPL